MSVLTGTGYATDFRSLLRRGRSTDAGDWLAQLRHEALDRFESVGLPDRKDEEWRETNVARLGSTTFERASCAPSTWTVDRLERLPLLGVPATRIVVLNGRVMPELSDAPEDSGVDVWSLADAKTRDGAIARDHLARVAHDDSRSLTALNTALFDDAVVLRVEDGARPARTVHVVHVASPDRSDGIVLPRNLFVVGSGAKVRVIETYVGAVEAPAYFLNAVTELVVGEGAHVEHVRVQLDSDESWHVAEFAVRQGRDSHVTSSHFALGARLSRVDAGARLDGEGAHHALNGLYVVDGDHHVDHHTTLDHAVPHCTSHELFKGILGGRARAVFKGRIIVRPDAQKTDAIQHNPNLLLSDDALIHTRPQLEIYADDVRCTHGATVGQIDPDQLFYLRSRGIDPDAGRDLLIHAFARDVLDHVAIDGLRESLEREIDARLPDGA